MILLFSFVFVIIIYIIPLKYLNSRLLFLFSFLLPFFIIALDIAFLDELIKIVYGMDMNDSASISERMEVKTIVFPLQNFAGKTLIWTLASCLFISALNIFNYKETIIVKIIGVISVLVCLFILAVLLVGYATSVIV